MKNSNNTSGFEKIVGITEILRDQYECDNFDWVESKFEWFRNFPIGTKGKIGEKIIKQLFESYDYDVSFLPGPDADLLIANLRIEVKMSMLGKSGTHTFNQFRDRNYDVAICLGLSPHDVHCWVLPKELIMEKWASGDLKPQHAGGKDTKMLTVNPSAPQDWLTPHSGRLSDAIKMLRQFIESK